MRDIQQRSIAKLLQALAQAPCIVVPFAGCGNTFRVLSFKPALLWSNTTRGAVGERVAALWLSASGAQILSKNWRCSIGEMDLIAARGSTLYCLEVKTRQCIHRNQYPALRAITSDKFNRLRRLRRAIVSEYHSNFKAEYRHTKLALCEVYWKPTWYGAYCQLRFRLDFK